VTLSYQGTTLSRAGGLHLSERGPRRPGLQVRLELANPGLPSQARHVRHGRSFGRARAIGAASAPDMAILRTGEKATVFVALEGGKFEPRTVTPARRRRMTTIRSLSGLTEGERSVTWRQFMLDSESRLREADPEDARGGEADRRHARAR